MKLTIDELIIKANECCNREENLELFGLIIESADTNMKDTWNKGAYGFVSRLFVLFLIYVSMLEIMEVHYVPIMFTECLSLVFIMSVAIRHSKKKMYLIPFKDNYGRLFNELKSDVCRWNDFKTFVATERELYICRNPIFFNNIDKFIYVTLVLLVLKYSIWPSEELMKLFNKNRIQHTAAFLLTIPMAYYIFSDSKYLKLHKIKALLKLIAKFEARS